MDKDKEITIADLYPNLSPEDQAKAEETIRKYIQVVKGIVDDLAAEGRLEEVLLRAQWEKRNRNSQR